MRNDLLAIAVHSSTSRLQLALTIPSKAPQKHRFHMIFCRLCHDPKSLTIADAVEEVVVRSLAATKSSIRLILGTKVYNKYIVNNLHQKFIEL